MQPLVKTAQEESPGGEISVQTLDEEKNTVVRTLGVNTVLKWLPEVAYS